jgi:UDP-2-acetamido-2,6-beta-L-arabino-hexul-4-ose reductase
MKTILVTGSAGFIGRHVVEGLQRRPEMRVLECDMDSPAGYLDTALAEADAIVHLAGVNRPHNPVEFKTGNTELVRHMCGTLSALSRRPLFVLSSSIQASLDNPYGVSKREAEEELQRWSRSGGGRAIVIRLKNVFGKGCRPNYNSVTATFCYNIARDLPITISDESRELELVYIDDVVAAFLRCLDEENTSACEKRGVPVSYRVTLGDLAAKIRSFRESRRSLVLPNFDDEFTRRLYATYLSYLDPTDFAYSLEQKTDTRGSLAEFMKSSPFGQIFVSRTNSGVTRGNHYHHTKTEKFLVVEGEAVVRLRRIGGDHVIEHRVIGREFKVIDIPPGYTHSIENVGAGELVTLFWASEIFDPQRSDTVAMMVQPDQTKQTVQ